MTGLAALIADGPVWAPVYIWAKLCPPCCLCWLITLKDNCPISPPSFTPTLNIAHDVVPLDVTSVYYSSVTTDLGPKKAPGYVAFIPKTFSLAMGVSLRTLQGPIFLTLLYDAFQKWSMEC
ncbi:unnamed protein product [Ilex paraguariensis]|uniref:Uncharacterized protein n=1 Tax=Ilex paraguariensis TaxID=185542 RepID=A0ABC8R6J8_9AQUA